MTTSSSPPDDDVPGQPSAAGATTTGKKRPILWMVLTGIAVVAAIGLGIWAVNVHSDLEEQRRRRRRPRHRRRHRQMLPQPLRQRSRRSTQRMRFTSSRTRTSHRLKATSLQLRRQPPTPAALCRLRRTKRPSFAPSSSKPERSATWQEQSVSRRESVREGRSAPSWPLARATPMAQSSTRSRALAPRLRPDRRRDPRATPSRERLWLRFTAPCGELRGRPTQRRSRARRRRPPAAAWDAPGCDGRAARPVGRGRALERR